MTESNGGAQSEDDFGSIPDAVVENPRLAVLLVWLIPILAALIGGFITWRAVSDQGPTVTITFSSAEGLEARKTKVRYKDLVIGTVSSIELSPDLSHVVVRAELASGRSGAMPLMALLRTVSIRTSPTDAPCSHTPPGESCGKSWPNL